MTCDAAAKESLQGSLLTDEEQDAQYRAVITQARAKADASGGLNSASLCACCLLDIRMCIRPFVQLLMRDM